jgi:uncharacterized membrane protein YphA (DoxX/SURF4 family)
MRINEMNGPVNASGHVKLFLRLAIGSAFLSAVADRLGWWPAPVSVWGDWGNFLAYTHVIGPWIPATLLPSIGLLVTLVEVVLGICLILGFRTRNVALLSGVLLLFFALSMSFSTGVKGALDFSVFTAAAASFALCLMPAGYMELDGLLLKEDRA